MTSNGGRCPLCAGSLVKQTRIKQERVPATVPEYWPSHKVAPYRRVVRWTVVKCSKGHEFKQTDRALYGMSYDL